MEELNIALATLIEQATTGIDASVGFLQAQLPDVVVQLLAWYAVKSAIVFVIVSLACFVGAYIMLFKVARHEKEDTGDAGISYVISAALVALSIFVAIRNLTWLQIWIAPKVWLLEYAANLVK